MPSIGISALPRRFPSVMRTGFLMLLCLFLAFLLKNPVLLNQQGVAALTLCATRIIPSLFPFFVVTELLLRLGYGGSVGRFLSRPVRLLFGMQRTCSLPVLLGYCGGFPVGAKSALTMFRQGECTEAECTRLTVFCNNCSPAFLVGVAGGLLGSVKAGWLLWGSQLLAALAVGMLFRIPKAQQAADGEPLFASVRIRTADAVREALSSAVGATLTVCGTVLLFSLVLIALAEGLSLCGVPLFFCTLAGGVTEFTTGMVTAASAYGKSAPLTALLLSAFFVGCGGLSVGLQAAALAAGEGFSPRRYTVGKALQGVLTVAFAAIGAMLFGLLR